MWTFLVLMLYITASRHKLVNHILQTVLAKLPIRNLNHHNTHIQLRVDNPINVWDLLYWKLYTLYSRWWAFCLSSFLVELKIIDHFWGFSQRACTKKKLRTFDFPSRSRVKGSCGFYYSYFGFVDWEQRYIVHLIYCPSHCCSVAVRSSNGNLEHVGLEPAHEAKYMAEMPPRM